ncbi:MAG: hypothetical protein Q7T03_07340 [Deltaproteobacteria bacterium]|nr:hypothetical protein [Deltaproteobacteria bacterium]
MGDKISKLTCPKGEEVFRSEAGEEFCAEELNLPKGCEREVGSPCGWSDSGWYSVKGQGDAHCKTLYCAPCQTIEYTCPDNRDVLEIRNICPYDQKKEPERFIPSEEDVYVAAQQEMLDLWERGCKIRTGGYFEETLFALSHARKGLLKGKASVFCGDGAEDSSSRQSVQIETLRFYKESETGKVARVTAAVLKKAGEAGCEEPRIVALTVDGAVILSGKEQEKAKADCKSGALFFSFLFSNPSQQAKECADTLTDGGTPHKVVQHTQKIGDDIKPNLYSTYFIVEPATPKK